MSLNVVVEPWPEKPRVCEEGAPSATPQRNEPADCADLTIGGTRFAISRVEFRTQGGPGPNDGEFSIPALSLGAGNADENGENGRA